MNKSLLKDLKQIIAMCIFLLAIICCNSNQNNLVFCENKIADILHEAPKNVMLNGDYPEYAKNPDLESVTTMLYDALNEARVDLHVRKKLTHDCLLAKKLGLNTNKVDLHNYARDSTCLNFMFDSGEEIYARNFQAELPKMYDLVVDIERMNILLLEMNNICPVEI